MINTPSIAALIRDNKTFRINSDIQTGAKYGMVTLDAFLMDKYLAGIDCAGRSDHQSRRIPVTIQAKLQELELAPGRWHQASQRKSRPSNCKHYGRCMSSNPLLALIKERGT